MKKLLLLSLVLLSSYALVSCDNSNGSDDPAEFRVNNASGATVYFNLGDFDGTYFDDSHADWVFASSGSTSSYSEIDAGTYNPLVDTDSNHSTASVYTPAMIVEEGKKYTFYIDADGELDTMSED